MGKVITSLEIPYPPSVNHYWRRVGARTLISREGRLYRERVIHCVRTLGIERLSGPLEMQVILAPPDNRRRDLDNCLKALLDALEHAGAYDNDSQIHSLTVRRATPLPPNGLASVEIHAETLPSQCG